MKYKKKAQELANKFVTKSIFDMTDQELKQERLNAKKNALICVDEILSYIETVNFDNERYMLDNNDWLKVKDEISNLHT